MTPAPSPSRDVAPLSEEDIERAREVARNLLYVNASPKGALWCEQGAAEIKRLLAALAVLAPKLALRDQLLREAMEQIEVRENTIERLEAQLAAFAPVVAELEEYRGARQYDACMDGPRFKGWNRSQLDRARCMTEAAERAAGGRG